MRRDDCVELFKRIPEESHPQVNVILRGQGMITVDTVAGFEPGYLALRGREGGSTDEARAFFVPYEEIAYLRIERVVKIGELRQMLGQPVEATPPPAAPAEETAAAPAPEPNATPAPPLDPAAIAKQNLLARIRAARTNAGRV
ncbi:MAG: hypothetical protein K2X82_18195 [Gemmataceae bacterium]|nr:hypothetical protein [Gemmataceae bacterium]